MQSGTFGICETCHEPIEADRLLVDPLSRNCLDHLSPTEQRALERDLDLAFQIQQGLLPKQQLVSDGWTVAYHYEPAGPVSGDYCDWIAGEKGACFFVGDVTGKGVAASMLMAQLYAIFRSLAAATPLPGELLARANRVFCDGTPFSYFATVVSGRIGKGGEVEISNAGHCPPLHVQARRANSADGSGVTSIASTGMPLGIFGETEYTSQKLILATGDSLVLYSDGLTEAFNTSGEQYGAERLSRLLEQQAPLPPQQLLNATLEDLKKFRGGAPRTDDLTIMIIRREG
jgi:sigma-B regulation protein RsbU (phosphoserine phosphatase)